MAASFPPQIFRSANCVQACLERINATENCRGDKCNCSEDRKNQVNIGAFKHFLNAKCVCYYLRAANFPLCVSNHIQ